MNLLSGDCAGALADRSSVELAKSRSRAPNNLVRDSQLRLPPDPPISGYDP